MIDTPHIWAPYIWDILALICTGGGDQSSVLM